nr:PREDICTED: uncharacterized protein LOC102363326 [Latimeria chalumnae]|eukprot:XP_006001203.2 PREDICTED: uncharacterized protein LOC102363326 [Latimeria chalumnae]
MTGNVAILSVLIKRAFTFRLKTFEMLLVGLTASNFTQELLVDVPEIMKELSGVTIHRWFCKTLKFTFTFGRANSIIFTILICIFRYQKLRHAVSRVNLPVPLDNVKIIHVISASVLAFTFLFSVPVLLHETNVEMTLKNQTSCPALFFDCPKINCEVSYMAYKLIYLACIDILPILIILVITTHLLRILYKNYKLVSVTLDGFSPNKSKIKDSKVRFWKSTKAVLAALLLFQISWTMQLIIEFAVSSKKFDYWSETDFLIVALYTSLSPYVFGIGNNILT